MSLYLVTHSWDIRDVAAGTLVTLFPRDLEDGAIAALAGELEEEAGGRPAVYLDFGAVTYLSSAVLGQLVLLHCRLRDRGRHLILVNLAPPVQEVLRVSRLTDLLDVRPERGRR
jgi:anti-anti-sigma factor